MANLATSASQNILGVIQVITNFQGCLMNTNFLGAEYMRKTLRTPQVTPAAL